MGGALVTSAAGAPTPVDALEAEEFQGRWSAGRVRVWCVQVGVLPCADDPLQDAAQARWG